MILARAHVRLGLAACCSAALLAAPVWAAEPALKLKSEPAKAAAQAPAAQAAKPVAGPAEAAVPAPVANVDPEVQWNDHFASHVEPPHVIRDAVRKLIEKREFNHVIAMIQAALRHGQGQPWMHEMLGIAMQASGQSQEEIERTLLSGVDLQEPNPLNLMYAAKYLATSGSTSRALKMFQQVATLVPTRQEPYLHGLELAQKAGNVDAIRWATVGILSQAWPDDKANLWQQASGIAKVTIDRLKQEKKFDEAKAFEKDLNEAMRRDVIVTVRWLGEADVDIVVEEPTGSLCTHRNPLTTSGGAILADAFAKSGKASGKAVFETYVCPQAFDGQYRMKLRRVWGNLAASKVTVDIYTNYGGEKAGHIQKQVPLGDEDTVILFNLDGGRRKEQIAEHLVANAADQQATVRRELLLRQLDSQSDQGAATKLVGARHRQFAAAKAQPQGPNGQAVGFQPVIVVLSEGASLSAQAVISADRRYVRFTGVPLFTGIGDVTTFNIGSGAQTRAPFDGGGAQGGNGNLGGS